MGKAVLALTLLLTAILGIENVDVAKKSDAAMSGFKDSVADMEMTLINARGQERVRRMKMLLLEGKNGDRSLMEFLTPADVKGTKFLSHEHITRDDDQWLYLPALKRVKRITSRNRSGSFMGSEFSYEDLGAFNPEKYSYSGDADEVNEGGKKRYRIVMVPKSKSSAYTSVVSYVDTQTFLVQKMEYYDRKKALLKTAEFTGYKKIGGVWRIGKIVMTNRQNDKKTVLVWKKETIGNGLGERDFYQGGLRR